MIACSQLMEIEDLVLGNAEPSRAGPLRAHLAGCAACRREHAMLTEERALFVHRASVFERPPPVIAALLRVQLAAEVASPAASGAWPGLRGALVGPPRRGAVRFADAGPGPVGRAAAALGQVLRRGHVSAACAAFLFALVAFSKLGGAPLLPEPDDDVAGRRQAGGPTASLAAYSRRDENLACQAGAGMSTRDDQLILYGATGPSSYTSSSLRGERACERGSEGPYATYEPSPICSSLRQ